MAGDRIARIARQATPGGLCRPCSESLVEVERGNVSTVVFTQPNDDVFVCGNAQDKMVPPLQARLGSNYGA